MSRVHLYEKPTCCGFIQNEYNTTFSCLIWGALSFYFAVLAFLNKSPFYSYISTVPLVAFGAANLLLGITSLVSAAIFIMKRRMEVEFQTQNLYFRYRSNRITSAVGLSVVAVLVAALVSFILFVAEKQDFLDWCITSSTSYVNTTYNEVNAASNLTSISLSASVDYYNCERLFQDEVKWGLMCLAVLITVYLHWMVVLYSVRSDYQIFETLPSTIIRSNPMIRGPAPIVDGEYSNIPPKKKSLNSLSNIKPSKLRNQKFKLFQKKSIHGAKLPTQKEIEKSANDYSINKTENNDIRQNDGVNNNNQGGNIIYFEDNIYNSKEEVIDPIENRQTEHKMSQRSGSAATLVNMSE